MITDASSAGVAQDRPPICAAGQVGCDPGRMDPDHLADEFLLAVDVMGHRDDLADGTSSFTFDFSTGMPALFDVFELMGLAKDPPDLSVFCDKQVCQVLQQNLALSHIKPGDAQQLLAMDPYVTGDSLDQHPERFEPVCASTGACAAPMQLSAGSSVSPHVQSSTGNVPGTGVTNDITQLPTPTGMQGTDGNGAVSLTYADVTLDKDFAARSAAIVLQSATVCETGVVDLWFDKAFGSFLWVTT